MILDFDKFFTLYNKDLLDDYFINRTMMNKNINIHTKNKNEIEKIIHYLISVSNIKGINLYLHVNSDQKLLEEHLITNDYEKIDEVIGLQYPDYSDPDSLNANYNTTKDHSTLSQVSLVDSIEEIKEWVNVYCLSFDISSEKKYLIYKILKKKFNIFYFILSKITAINDTHRNTTGCCILFPYRSSIAIYCLGTKEEYRHKKVATNIIDFSIKFWKENGYKIFGLQTLQSDNLLTFYERKGFVKIYNTKIYKHMNS